MDIYPALAEGASFLLCDCPRLSVLSSVSVKVRLEVGMELEGKWEVGAERVNGMEDGVRC